MGNSADAERDEKISRYLNNSAREIARVGDIVKNLLVFSRKTFGATIDKPVNEIVEHAAGLMGHGMQMKNIDFQLDLKETELTVIRSDASAVEQMLVAMLVNAMDATAEGGRIGISTSYAGREAVVIRVWDSGQGIPAESLPHIFEPFFSGKSETGKNIGMGLSVAWGVAQSHHGRIDVESKLGEGTAFNITLPLRPPEKPSSDKEERTV
jgi:two-component system NtrC family sensor kinase